MTIKPPAHAKVLLGGSVLETNEFVVLQEE